MSSFNSIVLVFVSLIAVNEAGRLFPEPAKGIELKDFTVTVKDLKPPLESCTIKRTFSDRYFHILLDHEHPNGPNDSNITYINNWKEGECGVYFGPLLQNWVGSWNFEVVDGDKKKETFVAKVDILPQPSQLQAKSVIVKQGEPAILNCSSKTANYAELYDRNGKLVKHGSDATFTIPEAREEDEGKWRCVIMLGNRYYSEMSFNIFLQVTKTEMTQESTEFSEKTETKSHLNLVWKVKSPGMNYVFERPDGKLFSPMEGVLYERYNYFGQGIGLREYGISIPKPLASEDIGVWKFMASLLKSSPQMSKPPKNYNNYDHYGHYKPFVPTLIQSPDPELIVGFIHVGNKSEPMNKSSIPVDSPHKKIGFIAGSSLTIQCRARSSLNYCYLRSPSGKLYKGCSSDDEDKCRLYTGMGLKYGDCRVSIPPSEVDIDDSGSWICGMAIEGLAEDVQVTVNVVMSRYNMKANSTNVSGKLGSPATILLTSVKGYALSSCRFNRPDGFGINAVALKNTTNPKYSYAGEGIHKGDCGLLIHTLQTEDFGTWKVSVKIPHYEEETHDIVLSVKNGT